MTQCSRSACGTVTAMTFDQALETLIAISITQLLASGRSDNRRLQEALRIATNYLELAPTPPAIGSRELEVLQAWMATRPTGRLIDDAHAQLANRRTL
jgi:uncharacterized protein YhdP